MDIGPEAIAYMGDDLPDYDEESPEDEKSKPADKKENPKK